MKRAQRQFLPNRKIGLTQWAETYRRISPKQGAMAGEYRADVTPYVRGMHDAIDDPSIVRIICMKSAQIGWTDGVINNLIGKTIDIDGGNIGVLFPREKDGKKYVSQEFIPTCEASPVLARKVHTQQTRGKGEQWYQKNYPGGFIYFANSGTISDVKSMKFRITIVEEPDDCLQNVGGQGDSIALFEDRSKTYFRRKLIRGGTPTVKGSSRIDADYLNSDQRKFFVPCHQCGEDHVLDFNHLQYEIGESISDDQVIIKGAWYVCPHCGSVWDDHQKNRNVKKGEWRATAPFNGTAGFHIHELYSPFPGSIFKDLAADWEQAKRLFAKGSPERLIKFTTARMGKAWEVPSDAPECDELESRALDYPELEAPRGVILATAGIDVQHDRLAIVIRGWGRNEESWLLHWGEIYGATTDRTDPVWDALTRLIFGPIKTEAGGSIIVRAASIDSSDGVTSDAVYDWVRSFKHRGAMAVKGSSADYGTKEIFTKPKESIDQGHARKSSRYGLTPYMVGTHRAKDLIIENRLRLQGMGPGRMHVYRTVRPDYWEQLLSEVKVPTRGRRRLKVWEKKAGIRNEALDCEVMALHAARSLRIHLWREREWDRAGQALAQIDLFSPSPTPEAKKPPAAPPSAQRPASPFHSEEWGNRL